MKKHEKFEYWNTPDETGVTRRQRKWAANAEVEPTLAEIAKRRCLESGGPVHCVAGSCVTCEARTRLAKEKT